MRRGLSRSAFARSAFARHYPLAHASDLRQIQLSCPAGLPGSPDSCAHDPGAGKRLAYPALAPEHLDRGNEEDKRNQGQENVSLKGLEKAAIGPRLLIDDLDAHEVLPKPLAIVNPVPDEKSRAVDHGKDQNECLMQ
jgi:hypothetical protein